LALAEGNLPNEELCTRELRNKELFKSVFRFFEKIIMKSFIKNMPKKISSSLIFLKNKESRVNFKMVK